MRLLDTTTLEFIEYPDRPDVGYAILSHRWGDEEVTFKEYRKHREDIKQRQGYRKIIDFCEIARRRGLALAWIDTCCIDKRSSAELSEAINSMYAWYEHSAECYVWLEGSKGSLERLGECNWFSRGWTLQEMLAPTLVVFFTEDWEVIGHKSRDMLPNAEETNRFLDEAEPLEDGRVTNIRPKGPRIVAELSKLTGVPERFLDTFQVKKASIAARMSWAAGRETTRLEDRAYSLLGLFQVHMPLLYGEGNKSFQRLQEEIMRTNDDTSIFCHANPKLLARTPLDFQESGDVTIGRMRNVLEPHSMTNRVLKFHVTAHAEMVVPGSPEIKSRIYRIDLGCHKPSGSTNDPLHVIPQSLYIMHDRTRDGYYEKLPAAPARLTKRQGGSPLHELDKAFYVKL